MPTNLLHFSDVHFPGALRGWSARDILSKKMVGLFNVKFMGRGRSFLRAKRIVEAILADAKADPPDALVFSGDATMLAIPHEFVHAAETLGVWDSDLPPGIAVPGNHDYYTPYAGRSGGFENAFAPWQVGERIAGHHYPFARRVGHVWLIGVNSAHQRHRIGASGKIGAAELLRLRELCSRLSPGPRILVTHYPLRKADGGLEGLSHRLRDHAAALEAAKDCGIGLWLHGHIHHPFVLTPGPAIPFPVINAGSATQEKHHAHNRYSIDGFNLTMVRRIYDPDAHAFRDDERVEMELREPMAGAG